ncbi:hypothetical protein, conserved [Angomonas deanei]|uniref:EGF-like domain-containing protein n=1 Tax=Angomonas deanei TaxID=59799 RepID=A0A7G2CU90_9TRYP|nr:hypothetical protein, conserved [Angomonas deanei]
MRIFIFLVLCATLCYGDTRRITASLTSNGETFNNVIYDVTGMGSASAAAYCTWLSPKVTGTGLIFQSYSSYTTGPKPLNVSIRSAVVTDSTIRISGFFPPYSNVTISQTRATMQGTTTLFDFTQMVPQNHVVFTLLDTTATWPSSGAGGAVLSLVDGVRTLIQDFSAFYLIRTTATNAMSVLHLKGTGCGGSYCFDIYNGLVAVDYASCTNCKTAFFYSELTASYFANSNNGVFRFSNCTQGGNTAPFFKTSSQWVLGFSANGNVVFSTITTGGDLFSAPTSATSYCNSPAQFVLLNINAKAMGTEGFSNFITSSCDIYMGNITLNGVEYTTAAQYNTLKISYTKIVNPFGMVLINNGGPDGTGVNGYCKVYCVRSGSTGVMTEVLPPADIVADAAKKGIKLDKWTRSVCQCSSTTVTPYCSVVYDPILYTSGFTYTKETCKTDPTSCADCKWGQWDQCDRCNDNYKFDATGANCVTMVCGVANCQTCVTNSETACSVCKDSYKLSGTTCVKKTCAQDPCTACTVTSGNTDVCKTCKAGYEVSGSVCIAKKCLVANCKTCVFDTKDQCSVCNDNYKLNGTSCALKTCAQAPCKGCTSSSGDDDVCGTCNSPYVFEESTSQCTGCIAGYKKVGTTCVPKECFVDNCKTCVFDTEDQCKTCKDNYKLEGTTCTIKTCAQPPCSGCTNAAGDDDVCGTCSDPYKFEETTSQCTDCVAGYKRDGALCVPKECFVDNCKTCVFDTEDQCSVCNDNYKLNGTSCELKTCAQPPCSGCTNAAGDDDVCGTCSDPYKFEETTSQCTDCVAGYKRDGALCVPKECFVDNCKTCVFDTEDQCSVCNDNYKLNGTSCELKTCAQPPCSGCTNAAGDDDVCGTCSDPYKFEESTSQCTGCIAGYKRDGTTCVPKECFAENCTTCIFDTEDQCEKCSETLKPDDNGLCVPKVCTVTNCSKCVYDTEDQCESCNPTWKVDNETLQCTPKVCNATNCVRCAYDSEDQCESCGGSLVSKNGVCGAKEGNGKLPIGAIIGIVIGVVVLLALLVLLLLFLCCRKRKAAYEYVDHVDQDKKKIDTAEETEVTMMDREGEAQAVNPLTEHEPEPSQTADMPPEEGKRRRTRRARSVRSNAAEIADIDLDYMYNNNEIVE